MTNFTQQSKKERGIMFKEELEKIIKQSCIDAERFKFITPIIHKTKQQILSLIADELPKESCVEGEKYQEWNSKQNIYEYGVMVGKNQALKEVKTKLGIEKGGG